MLTLGSCLLDGRQVANGGFFIKSASSSKGLFLRGIRSDGEFTHLISVVSFDVPSALQALPSGFNASLSKTVWRVSSVMVIG